MSTYDHLRESLKLEKVRTVQDAAKDVVDYCDSALEILGQVKTSVDPKVQKRVAGAIGWVKSAKEDAQRVSKSKPKIFL